MIFSRIQALEAADAVKEIFTLTTSAIDDQNKIFENVTIDNQYLGDINTHHERALLASDTISYLVASSYDLAKEKVIVLSMPRSPVEITVTEYGTLGTDDENLTFFTKSNNLSGNDLLLLPAGRRVKVYV